MISKRYTNRLKNGKKQEKQKRRKQKEKTGKEDKNKNEKKDRKSTAKKEKKEEFHTEFNCHCSKRDIKLLCGVLYRIFLHTFFEG